MRNRNAAWKTMILTVLVFVWLCSIAVFAEEASGDNSLSSLGITTEDVTVSPEFYYSTIEYNVTVPGGTKRLELEPTTSHSGASIVSIEGQDIGEDGTTTVVITVAAENGNQYAYYLYVTTDESKQAAGAAETETEAATEAPTEAETEPETEDPRYVKVDRTVLGEAENTIETLKKETSSFRDRVDLLTKILYGMIALCVILLFAVINLILKKKDLKAELQEYRGYGYPEEGRQDGYGNDPGYGTDGYDEGQSYDANGYGNDPGYEADGYEEGRSYGADGYDEGRSYDADGYSDDSGYGADGRGDSQSYDADGYRDDLGYGADGRSSSADGWMQENPEDSARRPNGQKERKARKMKDDPTTVPKPSGARKKTKQMPEYQAPEPEHQYEPPKKANKERVEVNMIDL